MLNFLGRVEDKKKAEATDGKAVLYSEDEKGPPRARRKKSIILTNYYEEPGASALREVPEKGKN